MAKKKSTSKKSTKSAKTQKSKAAAAAPVKSTSVPKTQAVAPTLPAKATTQQSTAPVKWAAISMVVALAVIVGYAVFSNRDKDAGLQSAKDDRPTTLEVGTGTGVTNAGNAASSLQSQPDPEAMRAIPELSAGMSAEALGGAPSNNNVQGTGSQLQGSSPNRP
jgi:hypothetical protein